MHNAAAGLQTPMLNGIAVMIIILCFRLKNLYPKFIIKLGTQSFYIFLFHTFYTSQWFYTYTYALNYPILIIINTILICSKTTDFLIYLKKQKEILFKKKINYIRLF